MPGQYRACAYACAESCTFERERERVRERERESERARGRERGREREGERGKFREHSPSSFPPTTLFPLASLGPHPPGGTGAGATTYFMTFLKANVFQRSNKMSCPAARGKYKYLGAVIRLFLGIWKNSSPHTGLNSNFKVLSK